VKRLVIFLLSTGLSATAIAEDNVRDGRPCLNGICVGDDISALSKIKWDNVKSMIGNKPVKSFKIRDASLKDLMQNFSPDTASAVKEAAPYLLEKGFDSEAIPKLSRIKGFCQPIDLDLTGHFKSDSGFPTRVNVNVEPGSTAAEQTLRVKFIIRRYPREFTTAQVRELAEQLKARYAGVKASTFADPNVPTWKFDEFNRELWLMAPVGSRVQKRDLLKQYPGCGKSLKID
jgi:hypothetical protein